MRVKRWLFVSESADTATVPPPSEKSRWYVPRSFRVGKGRKIHVGVQRKGDIIVLACGMAGYVGSDWLHPTFDPHQEVTCGHCLKAVP